jgi:thiosulfate/3-mercaptopyruvate sulfurtransferase
MKYTNPQALVDTVWLASNLNNPNIRILDASYFLPGVDRDPIQEFLDSHIPGAVFFDIEDIADQESTQSHMLPDAIRFSEKVSKLGISNKEKIIVYDSNGGSMAAARCWWMFRVFEHKNVALLNGGFPKWIAEKHQTENLISNSRNIKANFSCNKNNALVRDIKQMLVNVKTRNEQVVDARSKERFKGKAPEPKTGARAGHIPGGLNLPYNKFLDKNKNNTMRNASELNKIVSDAGIDLSQPIVTSCGSGVSAAMLAFGFFLIGKEDVAVYDGSWSEWGMRYDTPIEK